MSRSALQKSEAYRAFPVQQAVVYGETAEEQEVKRNELKIHGNETTFNMNTLLANNIYECDYFRALYQLRTYHEVIDEIYNKVTNVEPWAVGTSRLPSTAFCLLFKFFTMRLTRKQITGLLNHQDSPYIRCIGFLYLRYVCDPKEIWDWFHPYIDDEEEFAPSSDPGLTMTMGQWLLKLLGELQYYGTMLPRIPVPIERKIKMRLVLHEEKKKRAKVNQGQKHAFREGVRIKAIYEDAENDPAWYGAVITSVEEDDMYLVTFDGYANQELVGLGDMMLLSAPKREQRDSRERSRSRSKERAGGRKRRHSPDSRGGKRGSRSRSRSRDQDDDEGDSLLGRNLMEMVMKKEREAVAADGKNYGARPTSYKGSLSLKQDRYTHRKKSRSPSPKKDSSRSTRRSRSRSPRRRASPESSRPKAKSAEESERLKRLKERYGDASSKA